MTSLIIHGGAWDIPDDLVAAHKAGCLTALEEGWKVLASGGDAVEAVERAIVSMENCSVFDAGSGSHLNADGVVELDAGIMDGSTFRCGAVAAVRRISNPILAARKVMEECEHILIVGEGAERFASEHGVPLCDPSALRSEREIRALAAVKKRSKFASRDAFVGNSSPKSRHSSDTVGAVALDADGNLCVGTSTGGTINKYPGRVGDSPLIGCGLYAENKIGGVSTTGWGEGMIKVALAKTITDLMRNGAPPQQAAEEGIEILRIKVDGRGGVIVLDGEGRIGIAFNTPRMAYAWRHAGGSAVSA
jgi:beta-aspartyl-peptidase (threonine type)